MITIVEDFYSPEDLGIMSLYFMNTPFLESYHSKEWQVSNRLQAYPVHESAQIPKSDDPRSAYQIFKRTLEYKTNLKPLYIKTLLRKIKLSELKESAVFKNDRPHMDDETFNYAGLVYFNSNSIKDGTKLYSDERDFEPTLIVGARVNRLVLYNTQQPHSTPMDQHVEERWVQPVFLITEKETLDKYNSYINKDLK
jgi:hypothetical protein|tara:strand:+ start:3917 stop:4504 length:588 start_codon:yes stop_codon:yes gene_type:complete